MLIGGGLFYGYIWWAIDPRLQHHAAAPPFWLEQNFLSDCLQRPGGLLDCASNLLLQGGAFGSLCALFTTAIAALLGSAALAFGRTLQPRSAPFLWLSPVVLWLPLFSRYATPALGPGLGLLSTMAMLVLYARMPWRPCSRHLLGIGVLAAAIYYAVGSFLWLAAGLALLLHWRPAQRCWPAIPAWIAAAIGLPGLATVSHATWNWRHAYWNWPEFRPASLALAFYLSVPVVALGVLILQSWRQGKPDRDPQAGTRGSWLCRLIRHSQTDWGSLMILLIAGVLVAAASFNPGRKALLRVDYHARRQEWDKVLEQADRLPTRHLREGEIPITLMAASLDLRRALFHTDRLSSDLFSLWQKRGVPMLPTTGDALLCSVPLSETLLDLGQVSAAEHWAHEALELKGDRPEILRLLATINQVKDRPEAARIFLKRLGRHPLHSALAAARLQALESDPKGVKDTVVSRLRALMLKKDYPGVVTDAERLLTQVLSGSPQNRMAFEYLLSQCLLTVQLDKAVALMQRLSPASYSRIPRHGEEAFLLHQKLQGSASFEFQRHPISLQTRERFRIFNELYDRLKDNSSALRQAMEKDLSHTFWFYYLFGETPGRPGALHLPANL